MHMKKRTQKSLKAEADKLVSKIVRGYGKCEKCGDNQCLQAAHIYSRRFNATRHDLNNLLCLCAKCHREWEGIRGNPRIQADAIFKSYARRIEELQDKKIKGHLWSFGEHWNSIHEPQITVAEIQSYIDTYSMQEELMR